MKKLFALITTIALLLVLCVVPFGVSSADEPEQETGTEVVNIDFSEATDADLFGTDYQGWKITDGAFYPNVPWANAYLKQAITDFGVKKTVITLDIYVAGGETPVLCVGILDDVTTVGNNSDPSGITLRIYDGYETLYTAFAGGTGTNRIMDSQGGVYSSEPALKTLEMTFNIDKTVTVKVDGEVLAHTTDGNRMENVGYSELHDFSSGYLAVKATSGSTYIDNIKVVQYEETTPEDPPVTPEEPPILDLSEELGEIINIDFSEASDALRFGNGWAGGWEIKDDGHFHTSQAWESAYLKQPIETFGTRRVVITIEFYIANGNLMPVFSFGVVDNPSCIADDNYGNSGVTIRVFNGYETLISSFTGEGNRFVDSQWGLVVENPVPHTLEMTFDINKTVTVKVDGNILTHTDGSSMYNIDYAKAYDFTTGYLAMKATSTDSYISSIKVEQYDTPANPETPPTPETPEVDPSGDISQEPDTNGNGNGTTSGNITVNGGGTVTVEVEGLSGCNSSISGFSVIALVIAAGLTLLIVKRRHSKK